ncbi:hypothetical protein E3P99_02607 [Wallemia hederae]|uniref:Uncharacterized protein n=1 Tax=Wallemia hederae TaxID=1540922 RepID=A0A4T0FLW5_9BASI|nr:hypothetical protein E3P99_02607 [Wallemia hederae]
MAIYACRPCQLSHSSCDNYRPCHNCQRKGIESSCITVQHRRRGRPGKNDKVQPTPLFSHKPFASPPQSTKAAVLSQPPSASTCSFSESEVVSEAKRDDRKQDTTTHRIQMIVTPDLQTTLDISHPEQFQTTSQSSRTVNLPSLHDMTSVFHSPRLANLAAKLALGVAVPVERVNVVDRHGQYFASTLSIRWLERGRSVLADLYISDQVTAVPSLPASLPPMPIHHHQIDSDTSVKTSSSSSFYSSYSSDNLASGSMPHRTRTSINALCE